jgi:hypothetical protein
LNGVFYISYTEAEYPERFAFEMFEKLQQEGLNVLVDEKGELNFIARDKLKEMFFRYQDSNNINPIALANLEIEGVKITMKNNIHSMINNVDELNQLGDKANRIKEGSVVYQKDAKELESVTWWRNFKWTIIIILLVIGIALVIILPIVFRSSGSSSNNSSNSSTNTSRFLINN